MSRQLLPVVGERLGELVWSVELCGLVLSCGETIWFLPCPSTRAAVHTVLNLLLNQILRRRTTRSGNREAHHKLPFGRGRLYQHHCTILLAGAGCASADIHVSLPSTPQRPDAKVHASEATACLPSNRVYEEGSANCTARRCCCYSCRRHRCRRCYCCCCDRL